MFTSLPKLYVKLRYLIRFMFHICLKKELLISCNSSLLMPLIAKLNYRVLLFFTFKKKYLLQKLKRLNRKKVQSFYDMALTLKHIY